MHLADPDRVSIADLLDATDRVPHWRDVREQIAAVIKSQGWSDTANSYAQALGSDELDASALMLSIVGFLPGDDPRMLATIDAIQRHLTDTRGLVYRYRGADGLPGAEGMFLLCTFWLAHALAHIGLVNAAWAISRAEEKDRQSGKSGISGSWRGTGL